MIRAEWLATQNAGGGIDWGQVGAAGATVIATLVLALSQIIKARQGKSGGNGDKPPKGTPSLSTTPPGADRTEFVLEAAKDQMVQLRADITRLYAREAELLAEIRQKDQELRQHGAQLTRCNRRIMSLEGLLRRQGIEPIFEPGDGGGK